MNIIEEILNKLSDRVIEFKEHNPKRIYIEINPLDIVDVTKILYDEYNLRFSIASGTDTRHNFEILYHFSDDATGKIISIRTFLKDKNNPEIESITPVMKAAEWIEREMHELLGIKFIGHPNLKHLLLPDDWPKDKYPLRNNNDRK
ncbi:NADH-quinone oxidoreductase subunit C [Elusimicrobiota bacterium]